MNVHIIFFTIYILKIKIVFGCYCTKSKRFIKTKMSIFFLFGKSGKIRQNIEKT